MDLEKLNPKQFAVFYDQVVKKIKEDPIENFVKADGFIGLKVSATQEVIFKVLFKKTLDDKETKTVIFETTDTLGVFDLSERKMTEVDIYKFLTGRDYDQKNIDANIKYINLVCGRRCLEKGTLVATPNGPKAIEHLRVGDEVIGWDKNNLPEITRVKRVMEQGSLGVFPLYSGFQKVAACTWDHQWLVEGRTTLFEGSIENFSYSKGIKTVDGHKEIIVGTRYEAECFDIEVDNETNLYVLENGLITHNSGKTLIAAVIAIYSAITENWKPYLSKTPAATVLIMSPRSEFSEEILSIISELVQNSVVLSLLINKKHKPTTKSLKLKTPWIVDNKIQYSKVNIKVGIASSKASRGSACCVVICDEIAFWNLEETLKETDEKILRAVSPTLLQFKDKGRLIKLSSPGIKQGVLYKEYQQNEDGTSPSSFVMFKAPSWAMNPILDREAFLTELEMKGEEFFDQEYRANFADSLSEFMSGEFIELSRKSGVYFREPFPGIDYFAAIDAAFKADRFTFTIMSQIDGKIIQHVVKGWEGTPAAPVKATEVAEFIKQISKAFPLPYVVADQFSFQPLKEIFDMYGVNLKENPFSLPLKKKIYFNLKKLIHSQQIELLDFPAQFKELKELQVGQTATGQVKIGHIAGGHDDYADVIAMTSYLATYHKNLGKLDFEMMVNPPSSGSLRYNPIAPPVGATLASDEEAAYADNLSLFAIDPKDGKLKPKSQIYTDEEVSYDDLAILFN